MKAHLLLSLALALALPGHVAAAADDLHAYAAAAPLMLAPGGEGLQSLELPWPVLQASRSAGLADIRLFDAQGQVLPMAWAPPPAVADSSRNQTVSRFAWPAPSVSAASSPSALQLKLGRDGAVLSVIDGAKPGAAPTTDGAERWLLDLSALQLAEGERIDSIELDWPRQPQGLSTTVSVEASTDGRDWQYATTSQLLELSAADAPGLRTIAWPGSTGPAPRYLRLSFGTPLKLEASRVQIRRAGAGPALQSLAARFAPDGSAAAWQLDLQGPLAPRRLALRLPERNSVLNLRLEQRERDGEAWRPVATFVAWRLQHDGRDSESAALQLPPQTTPARWWRLVPIDGMPARAPLDVTLQWEAPVLVFVARGDALQLAVGRERAPAAVLPLQSLIPAYRSGAEQALPRATLGALAPRPEPDWRQRLSDAGPEAHRRWLLWGVLVAAVAGLGVLSWRLLRQIKPLPPA
ncbi:DUF3999 family protein [Paucibacter sp. R3-3]|uniref:DUF3999 family protein n=1 Tax=Roseateles agri TaxID=3098619 RepID=A0ABU5DPY8_9BURK|nr:DUF3999 family protein [Paucibacter sp. R3-3]MDY0748386.1 DUF3999 family protein [Paucibacter sp. R3-3]